MSPNLSNHVNFGENMITQQYNQNQQLSSSDSLLEEVYKEEDKNFYDLLSDLKYHLKELDILLSDLKKQV